jgi:hypothetical protein
MATAATLKIRTPEEAGMSRMLVPRCLTPPKARFLRKEHLLTKFTVARIAYLSSDVIISVQPAQAVESQFSTHLHRYSGRKDSGLVATSEGGVPEVRSL